MILSYDNTAKLSEVLMNDIHREPLGNGIEVYVSESYRFSTDTVLLADFSKQPHTKKRADLGSGCGVIPLLWLRDDPGLSVTAVELQENACELLRKSVAFNHLEERLTVCCADLRDLKGRLPFGAFDAVACNPPYKQDGTGLKNPESAKLIARHEAECTLDDVCGAASRLLQFGGKFFLCQRPERLPDVTESMRRFDLEPKRLRFVQQRKSKAPKLFLIEGRKGGRRGFLDVMPTLFIEDESGGLSKEMTEIYGCYRLGGKRAQ